MSSLPPLAQHGSQPAWNVALLFPPQGQWSVEEYLSLTDGINHFVEFSGGNIEVLPMPTIGHQRILVHLFMLLKEFVDAHNLGEVLPSVFRVRVAEDKFREPDITFRRVENESKPDARYWNSADLAIEIVSDDAESHERDYVTKRREYAAAGIAEYWIVDPQQARISVLTLEGESYAVSGEFGPGDVASSQLLSGFAVDAAEVFKAAQR